MTTIAAVRDLYRSHWGERARSAHFEVGEWAIDVLKLDLNANPERVAVYATVGASNCPVVGRPISHRVEFFVGLLPEQDAIAGPLAALGLYSVRERVALDHGHTVPAGSSLWPGSEMERLLVMRPRRDFLPPLELADGMHFEFLQAIPISQSELEFKSRSGADALMQLWEDAGVGCWSSERPAHPLQTPAGWATAQTEDKQSGTRPQQKRSRRSCL